MNEIKNFFFEIHFCFFLRTVKMNNLACDHCLKLFKTFSNLKRHIKSFHKNTKEYECDFCDKKFKLKSLLKKHLNIEKKLRCDFCRKKFSTLTNKKRHEHKCDQKFLKEINTINNKVIKCKLCNIFVNKSYFKNHEKSFQHKNKLTTKFSDDVDLYESCFEKNYCVFRILNKNSEAIDIDSFLKSCEEKVSALISSELIRHEEIKFRLKLECFFKKLNESNYDSEFFESLKNFDSGYKEIFISSDINKFIKLCILEIMNEIDIFESLGSGWVIFLINQLLIEVFKIRKIGGSYIPLPTALKKSSKNLLQIKNLNDDFCFLYCVTAFFYCHNVEDVTNPLSYKPYFKNFNYANLTFPLSFREIDKFIKLNQNKQMSINIYSFTNNSFGVIRISDKMEKNHIDLLCFSNNTQSNHHYVLIKNLEKLIKPFITKSRTKKNFFLCKSCLAHFYEKSKFVFHKLLKCNKQTVFKIKRSFVSFRNHIYLQKHPFVVVFDIECLLTKSNSSIGGKREVKNIHKPVLLVYKVLDITEDDYFKNPRIIEGYNCINKFFDLLSLDIKFFYKKYLEKIVPPTIITPEIKQKLEMKNICYVCKKKIDFYSEDVVLDHCHLIKKDSKNSFFPRVIEGTNLRSYIHNKCNLLLKQQKNIILTAFNNTSYDNVFILKYLLQSKYKKSVRTISKNNNQHISINFNIFVEKIKFNIKIIDSYAHLNYSLEKIVENLPNTPILKEFFKKQSISFSPKYCKLPFPYDYCTSIESLIETKKFPEINYFYNSLNNENLESEKYQYGKILYEKLKLENLMEYLKIYCIIDVLILCEALTIYRDFVLENFELDPINYISISMLSYDCMLRSTNIYLEVIKDCNILNLIKNNIRAGLSYSTVRFAESNQKIMGKSFNHKKAKSEIVNYDFNALYSHSMANFPYATGDYKLITNSQALMLLKNKLIKGEFNIEDEFGFIFCVDLK